MKIDQFEVSVAPHIHDADSVNKIMWRVIIALMPACVSSIIFFRWNALRVTGTAVAVCVLTEYYMRKVRRRDMTVTDGSAIITGMLLAFSVPPSLPTWMVAIGAFAAIALVKELFGGLGMNIFNPALAARAILLAAFPQHMTTWIRPFDAVTTATPLGIVKEKLTMAAPHYVDLLVGNVGGSIGETSALAICIGGLLLIGWRVIRWEVPLVMIATVFLVSAMLGRDPVYEILAGGLMLGAFFMATDMVTTPVTRWGHVVFAMGCGVITMLIRTWGGYPEGVCYSILIMNGFSPLIDMCIKPKRFGTARNKQSPTV